MLRCFAMMVGSVRVMLGGFRVLLSAFVGHDVSSIGRENRQRHASCSVPVASWGRLTCTNSWRAPQRELIARRGCRCQPGVRFGQLSCDGPVGITPGPVPTGSGGASPISPAPRAGSRRPHDLCLAVPAGFEPATPRFEVSCSIQLSYGTVVTRREVEGATEARLKCLLGGLSDRGFHGDLSVRLPDQAFDHLHARRHVGVRAAQVIELLQGIGIHADRNDMVPRGRPSRASRVGMRVRRCVHIPFAASVCCFPGNGLDNHFAFVTEVLQPPRRLMLLVWSRPGGHYVAAGPRAFIDRPEPCSPLPTSPYSRSSCGGLPCFGLVSSVASRRLPLGVITA